MDLKSALSALEKEGTAQNRKVYARHGVQGPAFGVSYAALGKLKKQVGEDQALAEALWSEANHDARIFATMIADPRVAKVSQLDRWARDCENYVLTDAVSAYVARTPHALGRMRKWIGAKSEWVSAAGWNLVGQLAAGEQPDDAELESLLETIEAEVHRRPNRTRHSMNMALIAIGMRSPALRKKAEAAARRIGPVEVDHGETGCKTPDPLPYLERAWQRRKGKGGVRGAKNPKKN